MFLAGFTDKNKWKHGERKKILLKELKATRGTSISVLGQNDKVVEYQPKAVPSSAYKQTKEGLEISVVRAQRIYNDRKWPNTVVVKLENVEFLNP